MVIPSLFIFSNSSTFFCLVSQPKLTDRSRWPSPPHRAAGIVMEMHCYRQRLLHHLRLQHSLFQHYYCCCSRQYCYGCCYDYDARTNAGMWPQMSRITRCAKWKNGALLLQAFVVLLRHRPLPREPMSNARVSHDSRDCRPSNLRWPNSWPIRKRNQTWAVSNSNWWWTATKSNTRQRGFSSPSHHFPSVRVKLILPRQSIPDAKCCQLANYISTLYTQTHMEYSCIFLVPLALFSLSLLCYICVAPLLLYPR